MNDGLLVHTACTDVTPLFQMHTDGLMPHPLGLIYNASDDPERDDLGKPRHIVASDRTMGGPPAATPRKRTAPKKVEHPAAELVLYVSGNSVNSTRAVRSLTHLMQRYSSNAVRMRIIDVAEDVAAAEKDRILFTPTLIVTDSALRTTRLLGSLSNAEVLADLLRAVGIEPT